MVNYIEKDKKRRFLVLKNHKKRSILKDTLKKTNITLGERYEAQMKLTKMNFNSSKIRVTNRCNISGRVHGVDKLFKISRIKLRELIANGLLPGIKKSSW